MAARLRIVLESVGPARRPAIRAGCLTQLSRYTKFLLENRNAVNEKYSDGAIFYLSLLGYSE
jgi:hypothetical protein